MAENLLEVAERQLGPTGISAMDSALGIPAGKGESALKAGMATTIAGMLHRGTDRSGLGSMLNMVTGHSELDLSSLSHISRDSERMSGLQENGDDMLDTIFGNKRGNIIRAFSSSLGLNVETGGNLLRVIAPITMSVLGQKARSQNLDMGGLATLLLEQKPYIEDKLPGDMLQELGVTSFESLGEGARAFSRGHAEPQAARTPEERRRGGSFGKWFWPLLIALAALYALNMCARKDRVEDRPSAVILEDETVITGEPATPSAPAVPETTSRDTTMEGVTGGNFSSSFREYLNNPARDPNREFPLGIQFAPDSATVTSPSVPDVEALVKILQEKPGVTIAIEGHTSGEGDEATNQQLSEERAEAVRQMLVDKGIDGNRITATGMGSAKPIADDSTEGGKEKNRRISVRVVTFG
ncbi:MULTISPECIES: OmpA family protein [unclassified Microbulbifer]|uniref:OmpA family protein n=1 Tax=unclassified Microbulbifer TaxID=2619833 RepID=UPI0027E3D9A8|nr:MULTISPECIES: OmpA family protein [unclassified Microbulbifer]